MLTRYMHVYLPFYFTHSLGRFLTTIDLRVQIECFLLLQVFVEIVRFAGTQSFFLFDFGIHASLLFRLFPDSIYIASSCHFFLISYDIMCGHLYVVLQ